MNTQETGIIQFKGKNYLCDDVLSDWFNKLLQIDIKCYVQEIRTDVKPYINTESLGISTGDETVLLLFPNGRYLPVF